MRTSRIIITSVVSVIAVAILARVALAPNPSELPEAPPIPDNGFTYQGLVKDEGRTANGAYDFEFALFYATSGVKVGNTIIKNNLPVVNGLVSTQLDFGPGIFVTTRLLLETRTRKGDQTGAFDTLISSASRWCPGPTTPGQCESVQLGRSKSVMTNPATPIQAVCST